MVNNSSVIETFHSKQGHKQRREEKGRKDNGMCEIEDKDEEEQMEVDDDET